MNSAKIHRIFISFFQELMSLTLKQMENIVNYHDKYPNRKLQSIQKQVCREFKDMRKIPLYYEYIKNGGTK